MRPQPPPPSPPPGVASQPARSGPIPPAMTTRWSLLCLLALSTAACTDIRDYAGVWTGSIEPNPDIREGFSGSSTMTLKLSHIDRTSVQGWVSIGPAQQATAGFTDATLIPMNAARADALADMHPGGDSLATFLVTAAPDDPAEEHAILVISAFPDQQLEVRVLRHDLYGLFRLRLDSRSQ